LIFIDVKVHLFFFSFITTHYHLDLKFDLSLIFCFRKYLIILFTFHSISIFLQNVLSIVSIFFVFFNHEVFLFILDFAFFCFFFESFFCAFFYDAFFCVFSFFTLLLSVIIKSRFLFLRLIV